MFNNNQQQFVPVDRRRQREVIEHTLTDLPLASSDQIITSSLINDYRQRAINILNLDPESSTAKLIGLTNNNNNNNQENNNNHFHHQNHRQNNMNHEFETALNAEYRRLYNRAARFTGKKVGQGQGTKTPYPAVMSFEAHIQKPKLNHHHYNNTNNNINNNGTIRAGSTTARSRSNRNNNNNNTNNNNRSRAGSVSTSNNNQMMMMNSNTNNNLNSSSTMRQQNISNNNNKISTNNNSSNMMNESSTSTVHTTAIKYNPYAANLMNTNQHTNNNSNNNNNNSHLQNSNVSNFTHQSGGSSGGHDFDTPPEFDGLGDSPFGSE